VLNNKGITAMISGHTHRYSYLEPDASLHDFPILINAHNTMLDIKANATGIHIARKDTAHKVLNVHELKPAK
jgi:hypothetical protein